MMHSRRLKSSHVVFERTTWSGGGAFVRYRLCAQQFRAEQRRDDRFEVTTETFFMFLLISTAASEIYLGVPSLDMNAALMHARCDQEIDVTTEPETARQVNNGKLLCKTVREMHPLPILGKTVL